MPVEARVAAILRADMAALAHAGDHDPAADGGEHLDARARSARRARARERRAAPRPRRAARGSRRQASRWRARSGSATVGDGTTIIVRTSSLCLSSRAPPCRRRRAPYQGPALGPSVMPRQRRHSRPTCVLRQYGHDAPVASTQRLAPQLAQWAKMSAPAQPARSSPARCGRKAKQACGQLAAALARQHARRGARAARADRGRRGRHSSAASRVSSAAPQSELCSASTARCPSSSRTRSLRPCRSV